MASTLNYKNARISKALSNEALEKTSGPLKIMISMIKDFPENRTQGFLIVGIIFSVNAKFREK